MAVAKSPQAVLEGVPISADHQVVNAELRRLVEEIQVQAALNGALYFEDALADLPTGAEGDTAFVLDDASPANNGVYLKGASTWAKTAALPAAFSDAVSALADLAVLEASLGTAAYQPSTAFATAAQGALAATAVQPATLDAETAARVAAVLAEQNRAIGVENAIITSTAEGLDIVADVIDTVDSKAKAAVAQLAAAGLDATATGAGIVLSFDSTAGRYGTMPIVTGSYSGTIGASECLYLDATTLVASPTANTPVKAATDSTMVAGIASGARIPLLYLVGGAWSGLLADAATSKIDRAAFREDGRLARNMGAEYPLRQMERDGITSAELSTWSNLLLDARVIGARAGKYYQVAYYQNGAVIGSAGYGWIIREFDTATFASDAGTGVAVIDFTDASTAQIDTGAGVQTITLAATHPDGKPFRVDLTVDPTGLPASGTAINSNSSSANLGWSWIIDPACYVRQTGAMQQARRNALRVSGNDFLNFALLDVRVIGARPGKYYGIRYFKNGTPLLIGPQDGWIIEEQDAATYGTSATALTVVDFTDPAPDITRSGVQTVTVYSPTVEGLRFVITLDTDKLPAFETFVPMNTTSNPGWSWIIDPERYDVLPDAVGSRMSWRTTAAGLIYVTWQSEDRWYRVEFGPNGVNLLPNMRQIWTATRTGRAAGTWTLLWSGATDWLPPMRFWAINDGVALVAGRIFTGGNHGSDGGAGGLTTAENVMYTAIIDGAPVPWEAANGSAETITLRIANNVKAANTIATTPARFAMREAFVVTFTAAGIELEANRYAVEDIGVYTEYGMQATASGFDGDMLFLGGDDASWKTYSNTEDAGLKSAAPDAWAVILRDTNGELMMWQDRSYGASDAAAVNADSPIFSGGGVGNDKIYGGIAKRADIDAGYSITYSAGNSWRWRGGWSIQAPDLAPSGIDAVAQIRRDGRSAQVVARTAQDWLITP